jgi:hypothetical protein
MLTTEPVLEPDPTNIGNVLLQMGVVTPDRLTTAVLAQSVNVVETPDRRLGAVMVALGLVTEDELAWALRVQDALRSRDRLEAEFLLQRFQMRRMDAATERSAQLMDTLERAA